MAIVCNTNVENTSTGKEWLGDYILEFLKTPSWTTPLEEFIRDYLSVCDLTTIDENKLEYTTLHNQFKNLVASLLTTHLLDIDVSPEEFASVFDDLCRNDARRDTVAVQLASVDDFLVFKRMMKARYQADVTSETLCHSNQWKEDADVDAGSETDPEMPDLIPVSPRRWPSPSQKLIAEGRMSVRQALLSRGLLTKPRARNGPAPLQPMQVSVANMPNRAAGTVENATTFPLQQNVNKMSHEVPAELRSFAGA